MITSVRCTGITYRFERQDARRGADFPNTLEINQRNTELANAGNDRDNAPSTLGRNIYRRIDDGSGGGGETRKNKSDNANPTFSQDYSTASSTAYHSFYPSKAQPLSCMTTTYPSQYYYPPYSTIMTMHGYTHQAYRENTSRGPPENPNHGASDGNPILADHHEYNPQQHPYHWQYP